MRRQGQVNALVMAGFSTHFRPGRDDLGIDDIGVPGFGFFIVPDEG
jgi:hypothetical protein